MKWYVIYDSMSNLTCWYKLHQRYAVLIKHVQGPEDLALRERENTQQNTNRPGNDSQTPPVVDNGNGSQRMSFFEMFKVYFRLITRSCKSAFYDHQLIRIEFILLSGFFIFICIILFFDILLTSIVMLVFVGCVYSSLWIPQIYRSAVRGSRPGLSMEYIIGGSLGRLFFALCEFFFCTKITNGCIYILFIRYFWLSRKCSRSAGFSCVSCIIILVTSYCLSRLGLLQCLLATSSSRYNSLSRHLWSFFLSSAESIGLFYTYSY